MTSPNGAGPSTDKFSIVGIYAGPVVWFDDVGLPFRPTKYGGQTDALTRERSGGNLSALRLAH